MYDPYYSGGPPPPGPAPPWGPMAGPMGGPPGPYPPEPPPMAYMRSPQMDLYGPDPYGRSVDVSLIIAILIIHITYTVSQKIYLTFNQGSVETYLR